MSSSLAENLATSCRRLFLRNYEVLMHIGVHEYEKQSRQRVRINVEVFVPLCDAPARHDSIEEVLDYDLIRNTVVASTAVAHIALQETLCDDVARQLLMHPKVRAVRVSVEKPEAYPDCESVGVEVFHVKSA